MGFFNRIRDSWANHWSDFRNRYDRVRAAARPYGEAPGAAAGNAGKRFGQGLRSSGFRVGLTGIATGGFLLAFGGVPALLLVPVAWYGLRGAALAVGRLTERSERAWLQEVRNGGAPVRAMDPRAYAESASRQAARRAGRGEPTVTNVTDAGARRPPAPDSSRRPPTSRTRSRGEDGTGASPPPPPRTGRSVDAVIGSDGVVTRTTPTNGGGLSL